ncbi:MAG: peroxiredoxin [Chthoniobacteraceae bacterium]
MNSFLDFFKQHGLAVGEAAPSLTAKDQQGQIVELGELYRRSAVFIYFYVRAGTPLCTAHACRLRDRFAELRARGIEILGVSADPPERLAQFQTRKQIPFRLLADTDGAIARGFRVPSFLGMTARDAYLIRDGRVVWKGRAGQGVPDGV